MTTYSPKPYPRFIKRPYNPPAAASRQVMRANYRRNDKLDAQDAKRDMQGTPKQRALYHSDQRKARAIKQGIPARWIRRLHDYRVSGAVTIAEYVADRMRRKLAPLPAGRS